MKRAFTLILTFMFCLVACSNLGHSEIQSWAFDVVTWDHGVYKVTNEKVSETEVEFEIGIINKHSTNESDELPNLFSNKYKKGTRLFKVKNIETTNYISVQDNDTYYQAVKMDGMKTAAN